MLTAFISNSSYPLAYGRLPVLYFLFVTSAALAQEINLNDLGNRTQVPEVRQGQPAPGLRVWQTLEQYEGWSVAHAVYLPTDWKADQKYPVLFEYPGNGGFKNSLGDTSDGTVEGCRMGMGLTEGKAAIWVSLPFVDVRERRHAINWWGDPEETVRYCKLAVKSMCERWGGDRERLVLCGFSRGAIATSYIGLRDDEIAGLWRGLIAHSHYDGVRTWPYADSDSTSALLRLSRFKNKPQWISHEVTVEKTEQYLRKAGLLHEEIRFVSLPYPNHSADWLLKDMDEANQARAWWRSLNGIP